MELHEKVNAGLVCEVCANHFGGAIGHRRTCDGCRERERDDAQADADAELGRRLRELIYAYGIDRLPSVLAPHVHESVMDDNTEVGRVLDEAVRKALEAK